jgi:hypothetical protein
VTLPPPRRRRSVLKIIGAVIGVIVMLLGIAFGVLWVTWTIGCWGRNRVDPPAAVSQAGREVLEAPPAAARLAGARGL